MKKTRLIATLLGVSLALISCEKERDPNKVPHADVEFDLEVIETRHSKDFTWEVSEGKVLCSEQTLQELWVTFWNSCTLVASSDDPAFDGVNFSSSNPEWVRVEKIDESSCRLVYKEDTPQGESVTISASTDNISKSFTVFAKDMIELEGIVVRVNDNEYVLGEKGEDSGSEETILDPVVSDVRKYEGDLLTLVSLVPENASFRYVKRFTSSRFTKVEKEDVYGVWPKDELGIANVDWSEIQGRQAWLPGQAPHFFLKLKIETLSRKPDNNKPSPGLFQTYLYARHTLPKE